MSKNKLLNKKFKKKIKNNLSLNNLNLDDISIDDLTLNNDESNFLNYSQLKYLLDSVSTCQLSDAYLSITNRSPVIKNLEAVNNQKTYGKIFTCKTESDDWGTCALGIDYALKDDILFILVNDEKKAIWGEIASLSAIKKGIKAVAIYGSCRDVEALKNLNFPVFSLNNVPNAGKPLGLGEINIELFFDDRKILPNDFFFGDENGAIIIEKSLFNEVLKETLNIKIREAEFLLKIDNNVKLSDLVNLNK